MPQESPPGAPSCRGFKSIGKLAGKHVEYEGKMAKGENLRAQLSEALAECLRLREENEN